MDAACRARPFHLLSPWKVGFHLMARPQPPSSSSPQQLLRERWHARARAISRRLTLGWWLDKMGAPLVGLAAIAACVLFLLRKEENASLTLLWTALAAAVLITGILVWALIRDRREPISSVFTRLDARLGLHNALSTAEAGRGPWPDMPPRLETGLRLNWKRIAPPLVAALVFLLCGALVPITPEQDTPTTQPHSWAALDDDLARLAEDEAVDEDYIEELEKRLEELREQAPEDYFSASSLEATDSLRENHENETSRTERDLNRAENALQTLGSSEASEAARQQARQELGEALESLRNGAMKPNESLMEKLGGLDPSQLGELSQEQMDQLRQAMRENAEKLSNAQGGSKNQGGKNWEDELMSGEPGGPG